MSRINILMAPPPAPLPFVSSPPPAATPAPAPEPAPTQPAGTPPAAASAASPKDQRIQALEAELARLRNPSASQHPSTPPAAGSTTGSTPAASSEWGKRFRELNANKGWIIGLGGGYRSPSKVYSTDSTYQVAENSEGPYTYKCIEGTNCVTDPQYRIPTSVNGVASMHGGGVEVTGGYQLPYGLMLGVTLGYNWNGMPESAIQQYETAATAEQAASPRSADEAARFNYWSVGASLGVAPLFHEHFGAGIRLGIQYMFGVSGSGLRAGQSTNSDSLADPGDSSSKGSDRFSLSGTAVQFKPELLIRLPIDDFNIKGKDRSLELQLHGGPVYTISNSLSLSIKDSETDEVQTSQAEMTTPWEVGAGMVFRF